MFDEDDLLPLSALQHVLFCERQAALIHVEQLWKDNRWTLEGQHLHHNVDADAPRRELRGEVAIVRGLALRSLQMGLSGRADVVELHQAPEQGADAAAVTGLKGWWRPFPVEYKRGKPKRNDSDKVQLCAQAMCLEEMLGVVIPSGALFYGQKKRRLAIAFDSPLRTTTQEAARRLHEIFAQGLTPQAKFSEKCRECSLLSLCLPEAMTRRRSALAYWQRQMQGAAGEADGG